MFMNEKAPQKWSLKLVQSLSYRVKAKDTYGIISYAVFFVSYSALYEKLLPIVVSDLAQV